MRKVSLTVITIVSMYGSISCNAKNDINHDIKSESGIYSDQLKQSKKDSIIVDDEFIFGLTDFVLQNAITQVPDSSVLTKNIYIDGVIDTIIYVNSNGMKARYYSTSYVKKHILWYADIDIESEIGDVLWRRLIESHKWPKHINIQLMDFEAQHLVRVLQANDGKIRIEYCLVH